MPKTYFKDKQEKKTFAVRGAWMLVLFVITFIIVLIRFAISGLKTAAPPGNTEAYLAATNFVRPTTGSGRVSFPDTGYLFIKRPDSVFIIKSYAEITDRPNGKHVLSFEITIKYNGGPPSDKKNWSLIKLREY